MAKIKVQDTEITVVSFEERDYIYLTDMANAKENALRQKTILKFATHKISFTPIIENIASDRENIFRRKPFSFY